MIFKIDLSLDMAKIFTILFGLYALAASGLTYAELFTGIVSSVYDGDTITVQTDAGVKKVRLGGIDAPKLKQPFGNESRDLHSIWQQIISI